MSPTPYFSVVIPTYNRAAMLVRVLDAFETQLGAPGFEVIVVDDGSTDDTLERLESGKPGWTYPLRWTSQENGGPGRARNRGISMASGRFAVFIGDDTVPEPRFLAEHAATHRDSGDDPMLACLGYTGWPEGERVTPFMRCINDWGLQFGYRMIEPGAIVPFNFFYTSNISIDRALLASQPFDTTFPSAAWEDIELAYRLDAQGLKIRYNAQAVTRHHHPMTIDSFARRQYTVGKAGAIFFSKHPELGHFLGVYELRDRGLAGERQIRRLEIQARIGERISLLARRSVFERLMRYHYLRGLRDGLAETGSRQVAEL